MPQLDPTWFVSQLFWLVVTFVMLYVVLSRMILPRLVGVMEVRKAQMEADLVRAQQLKDEADKAKEQYERALADARSSAQSVFVEAQGSIKQAAEKAHAELDASVAKRVADAAKQMTAQKQELFAQLQGATAELVAQAVEKLGGKKPSREEADTALASVARTH